jgi:hypothetical protein
MCVLKLFPHSGADNICPKLQRAAGARGKYELLRDCYVPLKRYWPDKVELRWLGNVTRIGDTRNAPKIFLRNLVERDNFVGAAV